MTQKQFLKALQTKLENEIALFRLNTTNLTAQKIYKKACEIYIKENLFSASVEIETLQLKNLTSTEMQNILKMTNLLDELYAKSLSDIYSEQYLQTETASKTKQEKFISAFEKILETKIP